MEKKVAIMQPYFLPYIGYFHLINSVDEFVIYDNIQYTKKGWINRNRILANKSLNTFTFSVKKDSYQKLIKERYFSENFGLEKKKLLRILAMNYKKAPYYSDTIDIVNSIFECNEYNLSKFIVNQLNIFCRYLKLNFVHKQNQTRDCYRYFLGVVVIKIVRRQEQNAPYTIHCRLMISQKTPVS